MDTFYRPYFNEDTRETAMLNDEQFAALPPDSPWRELRPDDPRTPAVEYKPEKDATWLS
jgi:hypothetical protein